MLLVLPADARRGPCRAYLELKMSLGACGHPEKRMLGVRGAHMFLLGSRGRPERPMPGVPMPGNGIAEVGLAG